MTAQVAAVLAALDEDEVPGIIEWALAAEHHEEG